MDDTRAVEALAAAYENAQKLAGKKAAGKKAAAKKAAQGKPVRKDKGETGAVPGDDWRLALLETVKMMHPVLCQNSALLKDHGCNLMHRKVLASFYQHLMAEAPMRSV